MKYLFSLLMALVISFNVQAQETEDKTLSPYFFVKSTDGTERLPLLHTEAAVNIAGVMADVKVTQIYKNEGTKPIEAIYVFPSSTRAAVYDMQMTIGERVIKAKIQEKQKARATYEAAKRQGKSASLLEQHRPNVFQMNVANILSGDKIKVELFYTELLVPEEGVYEFVYPTVVGPRYSETPKNAANADDKFVQTPYQKKGEKPLYTFDINTVIRTGIPIQEIKSPSHEVEVNFERKEEAAIILKKSEEFGGNKDYILRYKLKGDKIENGMLLFEGEEENFFLMMMQPPKRIVKDRIPPREYMFILDVSGSMRGHPMNVSKKLVTNLLNNLRPIDKFNILFFSGGSTVLSETSLAVNDKNIQRAIDLMTSMQGGGGTQLLPALQRALDMNKSDEYARTFITVTDGYVSVEEKTFELIQNNLGKANFFAFGIGRSVNRHLIEGMARVGHGEPFIVTEQKEADAKAEQLRKYIQTPLLHKINVAYDGMEVYDVEPKYIPDLMAERPLIVFGKYKGKAKGKVQVSGKQGIDQTFEQTINLSKTKATTENKALCYLWARHKIQILDDFNNINRYSNKTERNKVITDLGLKYNLLTKFTSFVAVDNQVRTNESAETVKQPLPMPKDVENSAVSMPKSYSTTSTPMMPSRSYKSKPKSTRKPTAPPPPPPSLAKEVPDEETEEEVEFEDLSVEEFAPIPEPEPEPEPEIEEVFTMVEQMPRFPGCESKAGTDAEKKTCAEKLMMEFIYKNLKYPALDRESGIEGTVVVRFVIGKDGAISDIQVVRSISKTIDAEAIRLVKLMPRWTPGMQRNAPVKVTYNLPIRFRLK